ncbi:MAG TPA: SDR family oxidoreductase [Dongiaceae bacterium]|jgi:NAD(P)-dependent dehydrogenase (short-subunit alcohol dehydrogenase family)|nr:SDR family oxidoreductase [Dongiaceae bacterium]
MPTVLVTGANRGIGLELARQYAADGWSVIATARDPEEATALKKLKGEIRVEALEVTDRKQVGALARKLEDAAIDVLINNAGMLTGYEAFGKTDAQSWLRTLHVNTVAPLQIAEAFVGHVAASDQRKIVSITSGMGSIGRGPDGGAYAYRSSKAGLNMAMATAAADLKSRRIAVAVISPGWVRTDMGGPSASIAPKTSVEGIRKVIAGLGPKTSGRFFNYSGEEIPW